MFDPTAFENMKVVIEGALYDRDLSGEISIINRNDFINAAKLSRQYDVTFSNRAENQDHLQCTFVLEAGLENLAAELLPEVLSEHLSGCRLFVKFTLRHRNEQLIFRRIEKKLKGIWGQDRAINQSLIMNPFVQEEFIRNEILISFNRLVYEDQMDDLITMIDYMIKSLDEIKGIIDIRGLS